ncbi:MAG: proline racemase family protein [Chloroherpetonaceae bacterium]|nr:proline racemase family protein [Chthonomonadaceae bacterium]MDW8206842.1 proline racemase family protein [Chloroherpetonaceae bacterium]
MFGDLRKIHAIDSHTGGEPTRVILSGGPHLQGVTLQERLQDFQRHHDAFRQAVIQEPRGTEALVGALLTPPVDPSSLTGVIFFNNVGYIGMCGHGTIGLIATLAHLGRLATGTCRIETPVGTVRAELHTDGDVSVQNVPAYRLAHDVLVDVPGRGHFRGDVAWGGNWFFLVDIQDEPLTRDNIPALTALARALRQALREQGITGASGEEIDHIQLYGPPRSPHAHSRNFVLCPGGAYDRSPCGTGTCARMACLFADGRLREGEPWVQESILGSYFVGSIVRQGHDLIPTIRGRAFLTAELTLLLDPEDPFCRGIR